ncbi:MAG: DUF3395 domain-containing protein [Candidatus Korobacteraceae bacterium]
MRVARVLLSVVAIAICATLGSTLAAAQSWQVMSADYGVQNNRADVTNTVRRLVNGPNFRVNNTTMGVDPARGRDKVLRIHARNGSGQMRDFNYKEGQTVDSRMFVGVGFGGGGYPGGGNQFRGLRIVQASYGAGNRRRDVTSRLQSMVRNDRLTVLVNNSTMGGDPAFNQPKNLQLTYEYQGQRRNTNMGEGGRLTLP